MSLSLPNRLLLVNFQFSGFPISCEGDVDGALGCMIAKFLGCGTIYLSDWLEHDQTTLTLWHGGMAPVQVKHTQDKNFCFNKFCSILIFDLVEPANGRSWWSNNQQTLQQQKAWVSWSQHQNRHGSDGLSTVGLRKQIPSAFAGRSVKCVLWKGLTLHAKNYI